MGRARLRDPRPSHGRVAAVLRTIAILLGRDVRSHILADHGVRVHIHVHNAGGGAHQVQIRPLLHHMLHRRHRLHRPMDLVRQYDNKKLTVLSSGHRRDYSALFARDNMHDFVLPVSASEDGHLEQTERSQSPRLHQLHYEGD